MVHPTSHLFDLYQDSNQMNGAFQNMFICTLLLLKVKLVVHVDEFIVPSLRKTPTML